MRQQGPCPGDGGSLQHNLPLGRTGTKLLSSLVLFLRDNAPLKSSPAAITPGNACLAHAHAGFPQLCSAPHVSHQCSHPSHSSASPVQRSLKSTSPAFLLRARPIFSIHHLGLVPCRSRCPFLPLSSYILKSSLMVKYVTLGGAEGSMGPKNHLAWT